MNLYIAGAHSRAATMGHYLKYLDPAIEIQAYLYDNDEPNPVSIDGVPVIKINNSSILDTSCKVYIATRGVNHAHLVNTLTSCGMKTIIPVDVTLDMKIRNDYLRKFYEANGRNFVKLDDLWAEDGVDKNLNSKIYIISSVFDKPLNENGKLLDYEAILQVGAELTQKRISDITDNDGENISKLNSQFCELTGLYWIWKNSSEEIVGLEHYRRHFLLPDNWQNIMLQNDIDVILPTPLYVHPSLAQNYRERHVAADLDIMYEVTNDEELKKFFETTALYSPCNMFIIKMEILNELCNWLFPILFKCVEYIGEHEDTYQNRYPGFMSERLITYFFEKYKDKYRVAYADKNFIS